MPELSAKDTVLTLPDTLQSIFSHIAILDNGFYSKKTRSTLLNTSLTSRSFNSLAQALLWQYPRDLNTLEQQVAFRYGLSMSRRASAGRNDDGLGLRVRRLRLRLLRGTSNMRLLVQIASFVVKLEDLLIHWGDPSQGGPESVTVEFVNSITEILFSLPYLKRLHLAKYSWTTLSLPPIVLPHEAARPFAQLEFFHVDGFHWYSPAYSEGLGSNLTSLTIGSRTYHSDAQILQLLPRLTSLTTLQILAHIDIPLLQKIVGQVPQLESLRVGSNLDDAGQPTDVINIISTLKNLTKFTFSGTLGAVELHSLVETQLPLAEVYLALRTSPESIRALLRFLKAKRETLKIVSVELTRAMTPTGELVEVLAEIPNLCQGLLTPGGVDRLLKTHPHIQLTRSLECLARRNALYESQFRDRLVKAQQILEEGEEENILGH